MTEAWLDALPADPRPWLLEPTDPAVRHATLRLLLDRAADDPEVAEARAAAMRTRPIAPILAAQDPEGWWVKPGPGYATKYRGTVWSLIILDQLLADGGHPGIARACAYVLAHSTASSGGFGVSGSHLADRPPPPSLVVHCLNGNLVRALVGFGWLDDPRLAAAIEWQARAITGDDPPRYYLSGTSGPGFECAVNERLPCAWGAIKALLGFARIPPDRRPTVVRRAIGLGVEFLLSRDPAVADYPMGWGNTVPNRAWHRPGFPSGYVADTSQALAVLAELGALPDPRAADAVRWLTGKADRAGRWRNEYAYNGKTWDDVERQGAPSKWVTLRACRILRAAFG